MNISAGTLYTEVVGNVKGKTRYLSLLTLLVFANCCQTNESEPRSDSIFCVALLVAKFG